MSHTDGRNRLKVFENRVTRKIFGPQRERVVGGGGEIHDKELQIFGPQQILFG